MGHPQPGAERKRAMGTGQGVLIETLAGGGLAAGFVAVKRGHAREAASGARRRGDRGVGVAPGFAGGAGVVVVMPMEVMVIVVIAMGRSLCGTSAEYNSCGEKP